MSQNLYRKMKKEITLTDVLLNQQLGEKRRHYCHLHLAGEVPVTGDRAGAVMILREDSCGSW